MKTILLAVLSTLLGLPLGDAAAASIAGARPSGGPVALVYSVSGEVRCQAPAGGRRPLRLFDRLGAGTTVEVGPGSRLALAFANGHRYELGERSRVTLGPVDLAARSGPVRPLAAVSPLPVLSSIEDAGRIAGAVPIRGERIAGIYPRDGAATLAGATVLRFVPVNGGTYRIEVQDGEGTAVFATETAKSPVLVPPEILQPGRRYLWTVRTVERVGPSAEGKADFVTLSTRLGEAREALRRSVQATGDVAALALLAEVDRSLGLLGEAGDELREAVRAAPAGVVVEEVSPGSAPARAGLQAGDELTAWSGETGGSGVFRTPSDLAFVMVEQAPRGTILLRGFRDGKERSWQMPPGLRGIEARPVLEPDLLALYEEGKRQIAAGKLDAGVALWRSGLEALERKAAPAPASWLEDRLASAWAAAARWPEADAAWERAAHRLEMQEPAGAALLLHAWGEALQRRSAWQGAEARYRQALGLVPEGSLAAARELAFLGSLARRWQGDVAAADALLQQAFAVQAKLAPGSLDCAATLDELAVLLAMRGDVAGAQARFSQALELQERLAPDSLDVAKSLINLGVIAQIRGDLAASDELVRRAVDLLERLKPDHPDLARGLTILGSSAVVRGDLAKAEELFQRGLAIRQKQAAESSDVAGSLQRLSFLAEERGDLAAAEELRRRALEMCERLAPDSTCVAESLGEVAASEQRRGDFAKADEHYRRALEITDRLSPASLAAQQILINRADLAVERGDLSLAEEQYGRALTWFEERYPAARELSDLWAGLGRVALARGDLRKAEERFRRAVALAERLAPGSSRLATFLDGLARVHRRAGQPAMATAEDCRATTVLDRQRTRLGGTPEARSSFEASIGDLYFGCLEGLIESGRTGEAFHALERGRARSFLALLAERDLRLADLPPALAAERRQVDAAYDRVQSRISRLEAGRAAAEIERLAGELRDLRSRQEEIVTRMRRESPRAAALEAPEPLDLPGARAILDPGTVLLEYAVGVEASWLFVVRAQGAPGPALTVLRIATGAKALREEVEGFRRLLGDPGSSRTALRDRARRLYRLLVRPAEPQIAGARHLLVSADGPLRILPFAALLRRERYLAEWKPISSVLSATVYAELVRSRPASKKPGADEVAAFGDPFYPPLTPAGSADPEIRDALRRGATLAPLPSTRQEVETIAALFPQTKVYLGRDATEERARSLGRESRLIHFACHGLLDERFPLNSALALTLPEPPQQGQENGLLQAWEIFESLRLDADLVTLSACDTALGKDMGGEGLLGLTRAFQYAGARSVLASLWSVSDLSTANLMQRFYRHLRAGTPKAEALQLAEVELIRSRAFSHPYHWAAFQLLGDEK